MRTWKKLTMAVSGAAIVCLATGGKSQATELVTNGSFETPPVTTQIRTFTAGQTFGNWRVGSTGNIQLIGTNSSGTTVWQTLDGKQSVDLNGTTTGSIFQDLTTTVGRRYTLSFLLAGNPDQAGVKTVEVSFGNIYSQNFNFDTTGKTRSNMGWEPQEILLPAATTPTTRLTFRSLTSGAYGPVVDNVSVVPFEFSPGLGILGLGACAAVAQLKSKLQKRKVSKIAFSND